MEPIDEPVRVDGVEIRIARATGPGVDELAQRLQSRWRDEGAEVRVLQQAGWQLRARWLEGVSELIQWRGKGHDGELLHSRLVLDPGAQRQVAEPFRLPYGCAWGRAIEGNARKSHYVQRTAFCRDAPGSVIARTVQHLRALQWVIEQSASEALHIHNGVQRGMLIVTPHPGGDGSALVWIGIGARS
jgi:hypothetical protein